MEYLYHNFTTTLSYSIKKFSIEVSSNKRKSKIYKALTKKKKMKYIHKRQENLLHLSKVALKNFSRQILTRETKDNDRIALHDWNS